MSQAKVAKTSSTGMKGSVDLLSNLPEDVRLKILEYLPLQDVVMTGILSTHWRYKWAKVPKIIFNKEFFSTVVDPEIETYSKIINNVLLCHTGPVHRFELYIPVGFEGFESNTILYEWLRSVSQKNLRELTLTDDREFLIRLPSTVFSYAGLTRLTLCRCTIHTLPPTFTGFPCLINLELLKCESISAKVLESVISSCPQLRILRLDNNEGLDLAIHAPKLEHLFVEGVLGKLSLGNEITNLKTLDIQLLSDTASSLHFSPRPVIARLRVGNLCLWRFRNGLIAELLRLKSQTVELIGIPVNNIFITNVALKLLRCSLPLRRLYCQFSETDWCEREWNLPSLKNMIYPSLEYVELNDVMGSRTEMEFIKSILESALLLKVITIDLHFKVKKAEKKWEIALHLMKFPRVSNNAVIIFKNETIN